VNRPALYAVVAVVSQVGRRVTLWMAPRACWREVVSEATSTTTQPRTGMVPRGRGDRLGVTLGEGDQLGVPRGEGVGVPLGDPVRDGDAPTEADLVGEGVWEADPDGDPDGDPVVEGVPLGEGEGSCREKSMMRGTSGVVTCRPPPQ
jgi:hypothetical protein